MTAQHTAENDAPRCHPRCALGPYRDHPGYLGYRCITESVDTLPWPGEDGYEASVLPPAECGDYPAPCNHDPAHKGDAE